jgi:hypothetical protein
MRNAYMILVGRVEGKGHLSEGLGVAGRIILEWISLTYLLCSTLIITGVSGASPFLHVNNLPNRIIEPFGVGFVVSGGKSN